MDLSQLANLGEFIGGVAVLLTLLYLAAQLRQNTRITAAQLHQEVARMSTEVALGTNQEELDNLVKAMADPEAVPAPALRHACLRFMGIGNYYETLFYAHERGEVATEFWASRQQRLLNFVGPARDSLWPRMKNSFGVQFQDFVDELLRAHPTEARPSWMDPESRSRAT